MKGFHGVEVEASSVFRVYVGLRFVLKIGMSVSCAVRDLRGFIIRLKFRVHKCSSSLSI